MFANATSFFETQNRDILKTFQMSAKTMINFLLMLENHYQEVPYHNSAHAADVVQSVHVLLNSTALQVCLHRNL